MFAQHGIQRFQFSVNTNPHDAHVNFRSLLDNPAILDRLLYGGARRHKLIQQKLLVRSGIADLDMDGINGIRHLVNHIPLPLAC